MSDVADIAATLADAGQTVTIAGSTGATYDPASDTVSSTPYSASGSAVLLPLKPYKQEQNSNIQAGDERMLLSASGVAKPPLNSTITMANGAKFLLIDVDPLHPDGTDLMFDCVVRGYA